MMVSEYIPASCICCERRFTLGSKHHICKSHQPVFVLINNVQNEIFTGKLLTNTPGIGNLTRCIESWFLSASLIDELNAIGFYK